MLKEHYLTVNNDYYDFSVGGVGECIAELSVQLLYACANVFFCVVQFSFVIFFRVAIIDNNNLSYLVQG